MRAPPSLAPLAALALAACTPRVVVRPADGGRTTFAWTGHADAAWLAGTMTGWRRVPLERSGGGFAVELKVPPGRHEYRLEVEIAGEIRVVLPEGAERVDDGYGGDNAVLRAGGR